MVGLFPVAVSTSKVPMIGPVQENETRDRVNAIKKMPMRPPLLDASSALLTQELGRVISKYPKNDIAKTMKRIPKAILNHASVDNKLSASAPKMPVISKPSNK